MMPDADISRIRPLLAELQRAWEANADLRLGQFLHKVANLLDVDVFYLEDDDLLRALRDEVE